MARTRRRTPVAPAQANTDQDPWFSFCVSPSGDDVQIQLASEEDEGNANEPAGENCHFHAGVEYEPPKLLRSIRTLIYAC